MSALFYSFLFDLHQMNISVYFDLRQMNCPAALERIREDRPISVRDDKGNTSRCIADIVSVSFSLQCEQSCF